MSSIHATLHTSHPTHTDHLGNPHHYHSSVPRWKNGLNERAIDRNELRKSFGNYIITDGGAQVSQLDHFNGDHGSSSVFIDNNIGALTPFRRAMNAGDPYVKVNMVPSNTLSKKPSNQVQGSQRAANQGAASTAGNGLRTTAGGSAYTGNPKIVYDSSDYIRYKKLLAKNNNYNDPTFGGDRHGASQVPLARVRRGISGI